MLKEKIILVLEKMVNLHAQLSWHLKLTKVWITIHFHEVKYASIQDLINLDRWIERYCGYDINNTWLR